MHALQLTQELVAFPTISSRSNVDVTEHVERRLREQGFETERIDYTDPHGVAKANVVGKKGSGQGGVAFFGHTDVVPADPWFSAEHGPFQPTVRGDRIYGRGTCDMKGSVACMLAAAARFTAGELQRPVYIGCTADEEIGYGGAAQLAQRSRLFAEMVAAQTPAIIGEPTGLDVVHAHKGVYGIRAISRGRAAHSSTDKGLNANLAMIPFLVEMKRIHDELQVDPAWRNPEFDPPTVSWNIGINDHTHAVNITAPQSICTVYFRPMPGMDAERLMQRAARAAEACGIEFHRTVCGSPVYVDPQSPFVREMVRLAGRQRSRTVAYGTDAAMLTALRNMVICGPGDIAQAHTHDEWIALEQLERGTDLFAAVIRERCIGG